MLVKPEMFEQALALAAAISAPTLAVVLAIRKVNEMKYLYGAIPLPIRL